MARLTSVALGFMFVFGGWTHAHAQDLETPSTQSVVETAAIPGEPPWLISTRPIVPAPYERLFASTATSTEVWHGRIAQRPPEPKRTLPLSCHYAPEDFADQSGRVEGTRQGTSIGRPPRVWAADQLLCVREFQAIAARRPSNASVDGWALASASLWTHREPNEYPRPAGLVGNR